LLVAGCWLLVTGIGLSGNKQLATSNKQATSTKHHLFEHSSPNTVIY